MKLTMFKKTILLILAICLLASCYTRKQAIRRFCSATQKDTTIVIHDSVFVPEIKTDTVFTAKSDTVTLVKDRLVIRYIKLRDSVYLSGKYIGDTIIRVDTIKVTVPFSCPDNTPTKWQVFWAGVKSFFSILGLLAIVLLLGYFFFKG